MGVPPAVPASSAYAKITVNPDAVTTSINWTVPGVNATNKVIGLHIHQGDSHMNGGILVGFCGTDPLPPFSGPCEQGVDVVGYSVSGQACDITGSGSPCVDTSGAGTIGDAAASLMANAADATAKYYLNLHTDQSFALSDDMALGLIRGQLSECPPVPTPAPTSPQACFEAFLTATPVAVPDAVPPAVPASSACAKITVSPDAGTT